MRRDEVKPIPRARLLAWLRRRGLSQYGLARAIQREPGLVGRVIRGTVVSAPIWREIQAYMKDPKGYRPAPRVPRSTTSAAIQKAVDKAVDMLTRATGRRSA